jgi:hypothetical protein
LAARERDSLRSNGLQRLGNSELVHAATTFSE